MATLATDQVTIVDLADGGTGASGQDAILLTILSSNGFIFKNSAITTTLTAEIRKGPTLLSESEVSEIGVVKWYKDNVYISGRDGLTLVVAAGDVVSEADYTAQLEG